VRSFAMLHAAMFDAVNSIDGTYTPYLTDVPTTKRASQEAAAAFTEEFISRSIRLPGSPPGATSLILSFKT
jgi:hypothetical protein